MAAKKDDDLSPSSTRSLAPRQISAGHACTELHHGRTQWLAYHIRESGFQIHPMVARKLLALIEGTDPSLFFELALIRKSTLPPAAKDPQHIEVRNWEMALEVARRGGFKRGHGKRVFPEVAELFNLNSKHGAEYVRRCVKKHRDRAIAAIEEENLQRAYEQGEMDFLGRPICPNSGFDHNKE